MEFAVISESIRETKKIYGAIHEWGMRRKKAPSVRTFRSAREYLKADTGGFTMTFIALHDSTGMELLQRLYEQNAPGLFIFVSDDERQALQAIRCHVFGYYVRPVNKEKVMTSLDDMILFEKRFDARKQVTFPSHRQKVTLPVASIEYILSDNHYIDVYAASSEPGRPSFSCRMKLSEAEQLLDDARFLHCNRGVLINMDRVASFDDRQFLRMENGENFEIKKSGRSQIAGLLRHYRKESRLG